MKKLIFGLLFLNTISYITFSMDQKHGEETKGHVFSQLDPELQLYTIERGIESILNSSPDAAKAVLDALKYLQHSTSVNKFLLSKQPELKNKLKLWAKEKFAPEYASFNKDTLQEKLKEVLRKFENTNFRARAAIINTISKDKKAYEIKKLLEASPDRNEIIKLIIAGADLKDSWFYKPIMPLLLVISFGDSDVLQLLLAYGANANEKDFMGNTPLLKLIENSELYSQEKIKQIAKLLLAYGVNILAQNDNNETALVKAKKEGLNDLAEFLLKSGSEGNTRS